MITFRLKNFIYGVEHTPTMAKTVRLEAGSVFTVAAKAVDSPLVISLQTIDANFGGRTIRLFKDDLQYGERIDQSGLVE